jgi:hypothetical protein
MRRFDRNLQQGGGRLAYRVDEPVPFCWFCDALTGQRAKEHVFPQWLVKELGAQRQTLAPVRYTSDLKIGSQRREFPVTSLLAGEVCRQCNSGWMSELEVAAAPVIRALLNNQPVNASELQIFTRWAAKTAVAINVSQPFRLLWGGEQRHVLASGLPEGLVVGLGQTTPNPEDPLMWIQSSPEFLTVPSNSPREFIIRATERTHRLVLQVRELVAVVLLPAPEAVNRVQFEGNYQERWPATPRELRLRKLPRRTKYREDRTLMRLGDSAFHKG